MSRILLSAYGALVSGATLWLVVGSAVAAYSSRLPGGSREGASAMGGFFFIGGACGLAGMLLGGWLTWRALEAPARTTPVAVGFTTLLAMLAIGVMIAMRPTVVTPDDYAGKKAAFEVEVSFPEADIHALAERDRLEFELRSGDGTETAPWKRGQIRHEGGRAIVPGSFSIREYPRTKIFAVMKNDGQVMSDTLNVEGNLEATTEWSPWQEMEQGLRTRWRVVVQPNR